MTRVAMLLTSGLFLLAAIALPTTRAVAQQQTVTADNLDQMIANMKTPADHEAIASYFDQVAADARAKAALHHHSAETYRTMRTEKPAGMANMCDAIAADFDKPRLRQKSSQRRTARWPKRPAAKPDNELRPGRAAQGRPA